MSIYGGTKDFRSDFSVFQVLKFIRQLALKITILLVSISKWFQMKECILFYG